MRVMKRSIGQPFRAYVMALAAMSALSLLLYLIGILRGNGVADWYLAWNLFLAWLPLVLAYALSRQLRAHAWSSWPCIGLSLAWLLLLPNSFYMVSDYIHLADTARGDVLYDALTFTMFILNALILGYTSLHIVQAELRKRFGGLRAAAAAAVLLLLCSFAIYLGRELRWNSWDVLLSPAGLLFDVSERVIDPAGHPQTFAVTGLFFIFLAGLYWVLEALVRAVGDFARSSRDW